MIARAPLVLALLLGCSSLAGAQTNPAGGPNSLAEAQRLTTRATELYQRGLYDQAEPLYARALAIRESQLSDDKALPVAVSLMNLARTYRSEGRNADALALDTRALALRERLAGPDSALSASAATALGLDNAGLGRFAEAETLYKRALKTYDATPPNPATPLANALSDLGNLYIVLGRFAAARPLFERARALQEAQFGPNSQQVAAVLSDLGVLASSEGRYGESEALYKRALGIDESTLGTDHPAVATILEKLANAVRNEGHDQDALPLLQRSLAIRQKALGNNHPRVAQAMTDLARLLHALGKNADAESLLAQASAIDEATLGPESAALANVIESQAELYRDEDKTDLAGAAFQRAITMRERVFGPDHLSVAGGLVGYAALDLRAKRYGDAIARYKRAAAIYDKVLAPDHPQRAITYSRLADAELQQGASADALRDSNAAIEMLGRHLAAESARSGSEAERNRYRRIFFESISIAYAQHAPVDASFAVAQLSEASSAGQAVAGMAARFAAGTDTLGAMVRQRQDLADRIAQVDGAITNAAAQARAQRDVAAEAALRTTLERQQQELAALDQRLVRDFPAYAELVNPQPLTVAATQKLLSADEALLVYVTGAAETWLWVVRPSSAALLHLDVNAGELVNEVRALRARLDPERNPRLLPYPAKRAAALYAKVLAPAMPALQGARELLVVPDGALSSLPLGVLVTAPPAADPSSIADHRNVAWLARDYAITVLPTVGSLRALRQFAGAAHATAPFLGVGNPVLTGDGGGERGARAVAALFRGGVGNVDEIRKLPPLPETADELRSIAKTLGAPETALYLGPRANEPTLRGIPLDNYRVIEFATHALVAGDFPGLTEPSLVLTPPPVATPGDDGLLTASKIATLKLNADWVVLSACNTAAGDGTPGAGGFSGLAKAFFYAGARSLLVSHWAVPSVATVKLTTGAFGALAADPKIGRAEALRRAMVAMWDPANPPEFGHPAAWAPFSLVGEGGAAR
jgi:CHAT domain-containing protein